MEAPKSVIFTENSLVVKIKNIWYILILLSDNAVAKMVTGGGFHKLFCALRPTFVPCAELLCQ